jgi:hypothetical protein
MPCFQIHSDEDVSQERKVVLLHQKLFQFPLAAAALAILVQKMSILFLLVRVVGAQQNSILQSFNPSILQSFNPSILQSFNPSFLLVPPSAQETAVQVVVVVVQW